MQTCNCNSYKDLDTGSAITKREKETKKILNGMDLLAEDATGEHNLYKCPGCGQFWQRSLAWMDGNKPYAFKVPTIEIETWKRLPYVQPDELFARVGSVEQYLERARFVEKAEICRREGCEEHAIQLSVLCAFHHMENIGFGNRLPQNCTWFSPYEQVDYVLSNRYLKTLPNYILLPGSIG
jgi:hypothetical protein